MENEIFKREDIKAGYLLCVENQETNTKFNGTVIPVKSAVRCSFGGLVLSAAGTPSVAPGDLAIVSRDEVWAPLHLFNDRLEYTGGTWRVNAVYGYAPIHKALGNTIDGRDLLWRRYLPKPMTCKDIETALGYKVKIVKEGEPVEEPATFKKSGVTGGMVVKLRNGTHRVVAPCEAGLYLVAPNDRFRSLNLQDYNSDLCCTFNSDLDVVEVWGRVLSGSHAATAFTIDRAHRHRLWKRDEAKRLTVKKIEEVLGYPILLVDDVSANDRPSADMIGAAIWGIGRAHDAADAAT